MSFGDKLNKAASDAATLRCKIGEIIHGTKLSKKEREDLDNALNVSPTDITRIPNSTIGELLREEGFDVSNSAVDRHRNGSCSCSRKAKASK